MENIKEYKERNIIIQKQFILKVFTIGYNPIGESIVILIIVDGIVNFSAVIDCYETEEKNLTERILEKYNIDKLNLICLTHPDKDHCKGMEKLLKKCDSKTQIRYPAYLFQSKYKEPNVVKVVEEIAKLQKKNNTKSKPIVKSCINKMSIPVRRAYTQYSTGNIYPFEIKTYAPVSEILERRFAGAYLIQSKTGAIVEHNEFSIFMAITLGDFKMLLCGDTENDTIKIINKDFDENDDIFFSNIIDYVKISHHCSNSSEELLNLLNNAKISNSVTTTFQNGNVILPDKEILEKYRKKSEKIFCTSNIYGINEYNYGVVEITADILNRTIKVEDKKYDETRIINYRVFIIKLL